VIYRAATKPSGRLALPTTLFFTFCAAAASAAWGNDTLPITDARSAPPVLIVDCRPVADPIKAPADGRIYIVDLWPLRADGGFVEISVPPGAEYKFSDVPQLNYRCSIINGGPEPISADFLLSVTFSEAQKTDAGALTVGRTISEVKWPIQIARIESGSNDAFQFYIHNYSTNFVDAQFPEKAIITRLIAKTTGTVGVDMNQDRNVISFPPAISLPDTKNTNE
jgi:hypothetical protein